MQNYRSRTKGRGTMLEKFFFVKLHPKHFKIQRIRLILPCFYTRTQDDLLIIRPENKIHHKMT